MICKFSVQVYRPDFIAFYRTPIWELDVWSPVVERAYFILLIVSEEGNLQWQLQTSEKMSRDKLYQMLIFILIESLLIFLFMGIPKSQ